MVYNAGQQVSNAVHQLVASCGQAAREKVVPVLRALGRLAARSRTPDVNGVTLNSLVSRPAASRADRDAVSSRDDDDWVDSAVRSGYVTHRALKRRICIALHDPVDDVLAVAVQRHRTVLCGDDPGVSFRQ